MKATRDPAMSNKKDENSKPETDSGTSRRRLLLTLGATGASVGATKNWVSPVINQVVLPVHASTTPGGPPSKPDGPPSKPDGPPSKPDGPPSKPDGPPDVPDFSDSQILVIFLMNLMINSCQSL
jgi:hypothetical protein